VTLLVGEAVDPGSLDASDLKSRVEDAERRLEESDEDSAQRKTAELDKARAEAFLEIAGG
jgi:F0F1-type ATP synthase epsilon subunit